MLKNLLIAFAVLLSTACVSAQDAPPDNSLPPARRGGTPPCLRQAGVTMSTLDELRSIAQDARGQVQNVCTNSSLTAQQKEQQIEDIHQQSRAKMAGLVSPDQRRAFMACRARHGDRRPVEWFERPGGGCGEMRPGRGTGNAPSNGQAQIDEIGGENPSADNPPPAKNSPPPNSESSPQKNDSSPQR